MKTIYATLLICLISFSSCVSNQTQWDAVETFFAEMGLDTFDDLVVKTINDAAEVRDLLGAIWQEWNNNPNRNWVTTADMLSKLGQVLNVVAGDIRENANNTRLNEQIDRTLNYWNQALKSPDVFYKKVESNILQNYSQIIWALFDLKNILQVQDWKELGKRTANLVLVVFKDTWNPSTLRFLADSNKLEGVEDCVRAVAQVLVNFAQKVLNNPFNLSVQDLVQFVSDIVDTTRANCTPK